MQSETAYGFHLSITKIPQVIKEINVTDNNLRGRWRIVITVYWIRPQIFYFTIGQPAFDIFALWKDINQCNALSSFFKNHNLILATKPYFTFHFNSYRNRRRNEKGIIGTCIKTVLLQWHMPEYYCNVVQHTIVAKDNNG